MKRKIRASSFFERQDEGFELTKIKEIATKCRTNLRETYNTITDVFFGHIHPDNPMTGQMFNAKKFHITGCSFYDSPTYFLGATFEGNRVVKVEPVFEEPARGIKSPVESRGTIHDRGGVEREQKAAAAR